MRGITVCVDYDDLLRVTLPRNLRHLDEMVVVTSTHDTMTQELIINTPKCQLLVTDAFYENGDLFNKGRAIEEGFDYMGRDGWIMILDADTLLPQCIGLDLSIGNLYSPYRRILHDPSTYNGTLDWSVLPRKKDIEHAGYCQVFHADDPVLRTRPWYGQTWEHAGGCDSFFQAKWDVGNKIRPTWEVLHLGPTDRNWCGRVDTAGIDPDLSRARKCMMNSVKGTYEPHPAIKSLGLSPD